jgi:predicted DsbA family dithiol-disulfide isomerase
VTGVPTFILASRYGLAGAQPAEELAAALSSAYARREEAQAAAE